MFLFLLPFEKVSYAGQRWSPALSFSYYIRTAASLVNQVLMQIRVTSFQWLFSKTSVP